MKAMAIAVAALMLTASAASAADTMVMNGSCLVNNQIDHTSVAPDTKSIVFYTKMGQPMLNKLPAACPGLSFHGFVYVTPGDSVCPGQGIRVLETGQVCMLGGFTPYTPPPAAAH